MPRMIFRSIAPFLALSCLVGVLSCAKNDEPDIDLTTNLVGTYQLTQWVQSNGAALPTILVPSGTSTLTVSRLSNSSVEIRQNTDMTVTYTINGTTVTTSGKDNSTSQITVTRTTTGSIGFVGNKYSYNNGEIYYLVATVPLNTSGTSTTEVYAVARKR